MDDNENSYELNIFNEIVMFICREVWNIFREVIPLIHSDTGRFSHSIYPVDCTTSSREFVHCQGIQKQTAEL